MALNFLSQVKLENFVRSYIKGTTFAAKVRSLDYGTFIEVIARPDSHESILLRTYNVTIPKGDKPSDTLQDVVAIIKGQGGKVT